MQDSKLINISQAVVGKQGVYSIEFHEDQHYTHVKRANSDGSETLFSVSGGSGGGTTYTAGTGIDITNGVISSTYDWSLFGDTGDIDPVNSATPLTIAGGTNVTTSISGNTLTIDASFTDTNDFVSSVSLNGTDLEFNGTGGAFSGTVSLASLAGGGGTESNIVPYAGNTINTDTVSLYGLR